MTKRTNLKPDTYLQDLFAKHPRIYFGDELKQKLVENLGKSPDAARKIVERFVTKGFALSSKPVSFGKNTFAYYPLGTKIKFDDLIGLTRGRRPPLFRLLSAIKACSGVLSYYEALKVTGTTLERSKTKSPQLTEIIKELTHFDAVTLQSDSHQNKYLVANFVKDNDAEKLITQHYGMMMVDTGFLYDVLQSLSKFNLIDNKLLRYRDRRTPTKGTEHNNFVWDAYAYTKTTGINTIHGGHRINSENKQALVVLDMVISRRYDHFDYDGFIERVRILQNNTKSERKIIPIIVFREIGADTQKRARGYGMLTYNMAAFFGHGIYEVIDNFKAIKINENAASGELDVTQAISNTLDLIDEAGNLYNLSNVTGDFFQSLMYQLFHHLYPNCTIEQGRKLPAMDDTSDKKKSYDYDLVIHSAINSEVIAVELKGTMANYMVPLGDWNIKNSLKWFFARTFPSFTKHFSTPMYHATRVRACFITSGRFEREGERYLAELNNGNLKANAINVSYNGKQLLKLVNQQSLYVLEQTLEKYFVKID